MLAVVLHGRPAGASEKGRGKGQRRWNDGWERCWGVPLIMWSVPVDWTRVSGFAVLGYTGRLITSTSLTGLNPGAS